MSGRQVEDSTTSPQGIQSSTQPPLATGPKKKKPYPFWLGGLAACSAAVITHPLDLTKVRMQVSGDKNMVASIRKTMQMGGGLRGLFDGLTGTIFRQATYSVTRFGVYDIIKRNVHEGAEKDMPMWKLIFSGCSAGAIAGLVGNPAEIILVRMQADKAKPIEQQLHYRNALQGLGKMVKDEGALSTFRGLGPNVVRTILMNGSQLAAYDWFKQQLLKTGYFTDNIVCHFSASFCAGTVATTVCSPADVIKSRVMSASGKGGSVMSAISNSFKTEGPMWMFKGWVPSWTRLQPQTILIFVFLEQFKKGVDWYRGDTK
ncbi:putative DIC1-mitochondrial dicarboxylate carrier protein [Calocera viscosa TUFC12733]|uniref:Putative DIC1-mitochondrial dicarboxylate carrier protein n=1 Tax=Calocera viscosa (strain TUFC12733) TaxID=1330018 RepID=A0A167K913_CALVF|nr:putative DIC1-mitochondrial dicarboxylate carrier protein [Calocera viscosa TUFC12733]